MPPPPVIAKRKHRLLCLQSTSLLEAYGGIEYYLDDFLTLAAELYGADSVWTVVPQRRDEGRDFRPSYRVVPVRFSRLPLLSKLENRFSVSLFKQARAIAAKLKPTLIVSGHVSLGPLAFALSKMLGIPYVSIAYGVECWGNLFPQDEWCLRHGAGVLSISHWTKRLLVERGYPAERIQIVQPALADAYAKFPRPLRPRPEAKAFTLLTVSRLDAQEQYKGQDHVIEALYRLKVSETKQQFKYIIQGEGSDRPRLEALVAEKELTDIVEFRGRVADRSQFQNVYRDADLYVMPSRFGRWDGRWRGEGFGIVYLEAAAFGVPSIAYNCGGATDIIRHGVNGWLVEPDDIGELARTLEKLARDPRRVFETGLKAYDTVMEEFMLPAIRNQLVRALDSY